MSCDGCPQSPEVAGCKVGFWWNLWDASPLFTENPFYIMAFATKINKPLTQAKLDAWGL